MTASRFLPEKGALLWDLVCAWYQTEAELAADPIRFPPLHAAPISTILHAAAQRVIDVITGEVCWSNTTPGDRAIWLMRTRMNPDEVSLFLRKQKAQLEIIAIDDDVNSPLSEEVVDVEPMTNA